MANSGPGAALRKIGEIADTTGMTVRTLHYYEEIGLLESHQPNRSRAPALRPEAVERLYRISLLRQLGLSLDGIRAGLDRDACRPAGTR